jgi:glutathione S-transferase
MELYFSPLACSMASRIAVYEAKAESEIAFRQVDIRTKQLVADGSDYLEINPAGQVPALRISEGQILTENAAILPYLADRFLETQSAIPDYSRYELARWLGFIGAELHKQVFTPLLSPFAGDGSREFARGSAPPRLALLDDHLSRHEYLLDRFGVADAYLITVLNWASFVQLDLAKYSAITKYTACLAERPSVSRAICEETALFQAASSS